MGPLCPWSNFSSVFKMAAWRWNLWFLGVDLESMSAKFSQTSLNGILSKLPHFQHYMGPLCPWSNFPIFFKMAAWRWNLWFLGTDLESMSANFSQTSLNWILSKLAHCQHSGSLINAHGVISRGFSKWLPGGEICDFFFGLILRACQRSFLRHRSMKFYQSWDIASTIWVPDAHEIIIVAPNQEQL